MHQNQVKKLTDDIMNNFVVSKKEQIFAAWRDIASKRAKYLKQLNALLLKNHLKYGFDTLNVLHNQTIRKNN